MNFIKIQKEQDFIILESLAREIWEEHYIPIIGKKQVEYMLNKFQSVNAISEQVKKDGYIYYFAEENGNIFGYIGVKPRINDLFLSKIYVKALYRGKGYGKSLMNFILNLAKDNKSKSITLTVNKNNSNSIKAYEKMGFKCIDSIVTDIGNGFVMDDYVMEKVIYN